MGRMIALTITGDGAPLEAEFNRRYDRMQARAEKPFTSSYDREAARLAQETQLSIKAGGTTAREIQETQQAAITIQRSAKETAVVVTQSEQEIREQFGISSAIIGRASNESAEAAEKASARTVAAKKVEVEEIKRLSAEEAALRHPGNVPFHTPYADFEKQELERQAALGTRKAGSLRGAGAGGAAAISAEERALAKAVGPSGKTVAALSSETDKLIAKSQAAIQNSQKVALAAEHDLQRTSSALARVNAETSGVKGGLSGLAGPALAFGAALAIILGTVLLVSSGVLSLAKSTAEFSETIYQAEQRTNLSAETLSTLRVGAEKSGTSLDKLTTSIGLFDKNLEIAAENSKSKYAKLFKQLGVDVNDNEKALRQMFTALSKMPEGAQQTALAMTAFGKSGKDVLAVIKEFHGDIDAATEKARSFGLIVTEDGAKAAHDFSVKLYELEQRAAGLGRTIGTRAIPAITDLMQATETAVVVADPLIKNMADNIKGIIIDLTVYIGMFTAAMRQLRTVGEMLAERQAQVAGILAKQKAAAQGEDIEGGAGVKRSRLDGDYGLGKHGGASKADSIANQLARAEMKDAELTLKAAERLYKEDTAALQREYDQRIISLGLFMDEQIAIEREMRDAKLVGLAKERTAAESLIAKNAAQIKIREVAIREVSEKEKTIKSETELKIQEISNSAHDKEIESLRSFRQKQRELEDDYDQQRIASMAAMAESGLLSQQGLEQARLAIQLSAFARHKEELANDLAEVIQNRQDARPIYAELMKLEFDKAAAIEEGARRTTAARVKDLESARNHARELRAIQIENQQSELELNSSRLDRLEGLGANSDFIKAARADQDTRAEILRNRQAQQDIISAQANVDLKGMLPAKRAEIEAGFRTRAELEEERHQLRLSEIRERPLREYLARIKHYSDEIGSVFADALTTWDKGFKGFFDSLVRGFKKMFQDVVHSFVQSRISEYLQSLFNPAAAPGAQTVAQGQGGGGLWGNLRGLLGLGGGAQPTGGFAGGNPAGQILNQSGGGGGLINNFRQHGFMGGLRNLIGLGGGAAATAGASGAAFGGGFSAGGGSLLTLGHEAGHAAAAAGSAGGASGLGSLGALFTNPWTAVVAGAAIGGFFLWKHFKGGTEKKLRDAIKGAYGVDIKDSATLKQIMQIGEGQYGKGNVGAHIAELIQLEPVKEIIQAYGESTGQQSGITTQKQFGDPGWSGNNFVVHNANQATGSGGTSSRVSSLVDRLRANAGGSSASGSSSSASAGSGSTAQDKAAQVVDSLIRQVATLGGAVKQIANHVGQFKPMPHGQVVTTGLEQAPHAAGNAVLVTAERDQGFVDKFKTRTGDR